jgi:uncharacterized protein (DUF1778 family)
MERKMKPERKTPDQMTEEELAGFYQSRRGDLSLWEEKPLKLRSRRSSGPTTSFAVRLTPDELEELQAAAKQQGTTLSDFIRTTSLAVARAQKANPRQELTALRDDAQRIVQALDRIVKAAS